MTTKINVGLRIPAVDPTDPAALRAFVQRAEALGFDSIWAGDHVFYHMDVPQPLHLLTWVAALTTRVRIGTSVMLSAYLNPVLIAKAAATLDCLSGGRLTLGVSLGGTPEEFASIGVPVEQRLGRLLENVAIMRKLWLEDGDVSYEGRYYTLAGANVRPRPVQRPIPVFFGANSEAMLKRAARRADGWVCASQPTAQQFVDRIAQARAWVKEAGRDPDGFGFVKQHNVSVDADAERARGLAQAHWGRYYGPRFNVASAACGTVGDCASQLDTFLTSEAAEITLALEPSNLDLGQLERVWQAAEGLRRA
jgi:probable F420-dependent oxidoreductase